MRVIESKIDCKKEKDEAWDEIYMDNGLLDYSIVWKLNINFFVYVTFDCIIRGFKRWKFILVFYFHVWNNLLSIICIQSKILFVLKNFSNLIFSKTKLRIKKMLFHILYI